MGPLGLDPIHRWAQSEKWNPTIGAVCGELLVRQWVQRLVKVGSSPHQQESPMRGYGDQSIVVYGENG